MQLTMSKIGDGWIISITDPNGITQGLEQINVQASGDGYTVTLPEGTEPFFVTSQLDNYLEKAGGTLTGNLILDEGINIELGTTTGSQIGTADNQLLALWGATPITQPAHAEQTLLTNSLGGIYDGTLVDVTTAMLADPTKTNQNFTNLYALVVQIQTAMVNIGAIKGGA